MTSRSNQFAAGCFAAIDGKRGCAGSTGAETRRKVRWRGSDQTWWSAKTAVPRALVGREERGEASAQAGDQPVGDLGERARLDVGPQLTRTRRAERARREAPGPR